MVEDKKASKSLDVKSACDEEQARITLPKLIDIQLMDDADGEPAQPMEGYNPRYKNIVDYIIGVTHEIWEEHGIGKLYEYYANTVKMHTASGLKFGREAVIAATIESQASFPDRRLFGEEVIWRGNNVDGFYTSHRLRHEGNQSRLDAIWSSNGQTCQLSRHRRLCLRTKYDGGRVDLAR